MSQGTHIVTILPFYKCQCLTCILARYRMQQSLMYREMHKYDYLHAEDEVAWNFRPNCTCRFCMQVVDDMHNWSDEFDRGEETPCIF